MSVSKQIRDKLKENWNKRVKKHNKCRCFQTDVIKPFVDMSPYSEVSLQINTEFFKLITYVPLMMKHLYPDGSGLFHHDSAPTHRA